MPRGMLGKEELWESEMAFVCTYFAVRLRLRVVICTSTGSLCRVAMVVDGRGARTLREE
jgi:hypothetical protein